MQTMQEHPSIVTRRTSFIAQPAVSLGGGVMRAGFHSTQHAQHAARRTQRAAYSARHRVSARG